MKRTTFYVAALVVLFAGAMTAQAQAQATRTWVSGVGDDANPCSRTAPCKTFAGAISKTAAKGEINCLDPGGFGALTITKSIAISCEAGTAGVLVSGTNGITISAATTDTVYLSGLDFEGIGSSLAGISVTQVGTLRVTNSSIHQFTTGISVTPSGNGAVIELSDVFVSESSGEGIFSKPTSGGSVRMTIDRSRIFHNGGDGVMANGNGGGSVKVSVRDSESSSNGANGFVALSSTSVAQLLLDSCTSFNNSGIGVSASGTLATSRFTRSSITGNTTGVSSDTGGMALSYGTNSVDGNGADGMFSTIPQK